MRQLGSKWKFTSFSFRVGDTFGLDDYLNQKNRELEETVVGINKRYMDFASKDLLETLDDLRYSNAMFYLDRVDEKCQSFLNTLKQEVSQKLAELKSRTEKKDCSEPIPIEPLFSCGGTEGWRRVFLLDMADSTSMCPFGWETIEKQQSLGGIRVCSGGYREKCGSAFLPVVGEYTKVCGRIKGYQQEKPSAFARYSYDPDETTLDSNYVDGVSLTHGKPRQHIWTFAAGSGEIPEVGYEEESCPCENNNAKATVPPFVGEDYFCESGYNDQSYHYPHNEFYLDDPLWDGKNCLASSTCCTKNNPPYFVKELSSPTSGNIEARLCTGQYGDTFFPEAFVAEMELYVQ